MTPLPGSTGAKPRKPLICVTVHRRYTELAANLQVIHTLFHEFAQTPDVVLIVAQPEWDAVPFFERLREMGLVQHVVYRPSNGLDGPVTTYPESHNIRLALSFCQDLYGPEPYVILQAADICPLPKVYKLVDDHMQTGGSGVLFFWENPQVRGDIWHTNFFAVNLDNPSSWPPVAVGHNADVLERQWGHQLRNTGYPGNWLQSHNSRQQKFVHDHLVLAPLPRSDKPLPVRSPKLSWLRKWLPWLITLTV